MPSAFFEQRLADRQRKQEAHHVGIDAAGQQDQVALQRLGLDALGEVGVGLAGARLAEFHRHHRAETAHVGDLRHLGAQRFEHAP